VADSAPGRTCRSPGTWGQRPTFSPGSWGQGHTDTGDIYEQAVQIELEDGETLVLRRIEVHLQDPTEDGETVIRILTNLPKNTSAEEAASAYRYRWKIENMFQWLESVLHNEVRTLGHPRAALFAFSVAVDVFAAAGDEQIIRLALAAPAPKPVPEHNPPPSVTSGDTPP
jgi:hypothetical protein